MKLDNTAAAVLVQRFTANAVTILGILLLTYVVIQKRKLFTSFLPKMMQSKIQSKTNIWILC